MAMRLNVRWKTALIIIAALLAFFAWGRWSGNMTRAAVERTRRELRQTGFRTDLSDFNFTLPTEIGERASAIISAGQEVRSLRNANDLQLIETVGTNVALAISPIAIIKTYRATNLWPLVKEDLSNHDAELDHACAALLAGPVKFQPTVRTGGDMRLPYLADYEMLARALAVRAVLAMHEHDTNGVFTNLFALSRMVTAWTPEPVDMSHMVRFACEAIAQQAIWESMQTDYWNEAQLSALQREWESARFFDGLPETAELACANMVTMCHAARDESYSANIGGWGPAIRDIFSSPASGFRDLWRAIQGFGQHASYRNHGSYVDENALLLYYRDRNQELKRAVACSTWAEMRLLPSATNTVVFQGMKWSRIGVMMNLKQMTLGFQRQGRTLISRAAETEARRRLIVTAIALERFAIQHKTYPQSLTELVPAFLAALPVDFMDGKEMRYWRREDGRYLLYSVGLDCVDNGGTIATPNLRRRSFSGEGGLFSPKTGADLVWPLPATQADLDAFEKAQENDEKRSESTDIP